MFLISAVLSDKKGGMFNVLGYLLLAAPLFMVAPQVFRTVKRRDVSGVSVSMQVGLVGSWFMFLW